MINFRNCSSSFPQLLLKIKDARRRLDINVNNTTFRQGQTSPELPLFTMVQFIIITLATLANPKGSTLKDIRRLLYASGLIDESTDLRRAMIAGLKSGVIARPVWAMKSGVYGVYVEGDGIPIHAGKNSRPKPKKRTALAGTKKKATPQRMPRFVIHKRPIKRRRRTELADTPDFKSTAEGRKNRRKR